MDVKKIMEAATVIESLAGQVRKELEGLGISAPVFIQEKEGAEEDMKPLQAWESVSRRLGEHAREHGYTQEDIKADVMAYVALTDYFPKAGGEKHERK